MSKDVAPLNEEPEIEINPVMHLVAPVAAIVGTMIVRKVVNTVYEKSTGHSAPEPRDPATSVTRAIVWAAMIAATAAVAEVAIYRLVDRMGEKKYPA